MAEPDPNEYQYLYGTGGSAHLPTNPRSPTLGPYHHQMFASLMQQQHAYSFAQKLHQAYGGGGSPLQHALPTPTQQTIPLTQHHQIQLQMQQASREAGMLPHFYSKTALALLRKDKNLSYASRNSLNIEGEMEDDDLTNIADSEHKEAQRWHGIDFSGMRLKNLCIELYQYQFLVKIHASHNILTELPSGIAKLRSLQHLDVSSNQLTSVPPELGMCTNIKELLLFDNLIRELPGELGTLYQLEVLGLEGNPLTEALKMILYTEGSRGVIDHLRDNFMRTSLH